MLSHHLQNCTRSSRCRWNPLLYQCKAGCNCGIQLHIRQLQKRKLFDRGFVQLSLHWYYHITEQIWASRRTFIKHSLVLQHDRRFSKQWTPAFKASSIHPKSLMSKCSASRSTLQFKCTGFDFKQGNTDMALRLSYKCFNNTEIIKSTRHCRNHLNASESRPFERLSSTCYTFLFTFCRVYKR